MSMQERYNRLRDYQERLRREKLAQEKAERIAQQERRDSLRPQAIERAKEIMTALKVREALEDIKGEWGCGEITDAVIANGSIIVPQGTGFQLGYNFAMANVWGLPSNMFMELANEQTALQIFLGPDIQRKPEEEPVLVLVDRGFFSRALNPHNKPNVAEYVRQYGLVGGLRSLQDRDELSKFENPIIVTELSGADVEDRFNEALVGAVRSRSIDGYFPKRIEQRAQEIIDQFPPALQKRGGLDLEELKKWEHELVWGKGIRTGLRIWYHRLSGLGAQV